MEPNIIFNMTICLMGMLIFLIHIVNVCFKKNRRKDENSLLNFLVLTAIHFLIYFVFTLIKINYTSDPFIISFYTVFYVLNNMEVAFLFIYMLNYIDLKQKTKKTLAIISLSSFCIFITLDIANAFTGIFFTSVNGVYQRSTTMIFAQGYQFIGLAIVLFTALFNKKLLLREKIAFATYCLLPAVAIVLQNFFKGYAIAYASMILATEILFFFLNVAKNIQLAEEQEKAKDAQIRVLMSQIHPHFVYNSLSAISTLITIDPEKAQKGLDDFTAYLRHNISSLSDAKLIPFEEELKHVEAYVSLEKMRFGDRVNVSYDIKFRDFVLPPLTIQPLVENAIKHGILKKIEGGKVLFRVWEDNGLVSIEIEDDGVGFDIDMIEKDGKKHFGLKNIGKRLKSMCDGSLFIESEIGKGTKATVELKKKGEA